MPLLLQIVIISLFIMCSLGFAQENQVLGFQNWKEQQVLEAQNQVLRNSSRIGQLKGAKPKDSKDASLPENSRIKKAYDSKDAIEKDLKRSQESLEAAGGLQFEDYINIYLPTLENQPESLNKLTDKLSKEELAEIVKVLVKKNAKLPDAKRNSTAALEGARAK